MALDKGKLKSDIKSILTDMMERETNSFDEFAERLAGAVDSYTKKAEIEYISGLSNSGGPVTGTFKGNLK